MKTVKEGGVSSRTTSPTERHGRGRILLLRFDVVLEGQLGAILHVLLVGFEVVLGVLTAWGDRKWSVALTGSHRAR